MIKHIVMLANKYGQGSYGVGDTEKDAKKIARKEFGGGKPKETRHRTVDVPEGSKLVVQSLCNGVEWWIETPIPETVS